MTSDGRCESVAELCDYIVENATTIYVRGWTSGKVGTMRLSDVPATAALTFAMDWIKRMKTPSRVRDESEISAGNTLGP